MPVAVGNEIGHNESAVSLSSVAIAITEDVPAGDTILIFIGASNPANAVSATDSKGNVYSVDRIVGGGNSRAAVLSCVVQKPLKLADGDTITPNFGGSTTSTLVSIYHLTGIYAMAPLDKTGIATGSSVSPSASTGSSTYQDDEIVFVVVGYGATTAGAITDPGGYTRLVARETATVRALYVAYKALSATGIQSTGPTLTNSESWAEVIAAYRAVPAQQWCPSRRGPWLLRGTLGGVLRGFRPPPQAADPNVQVNGTTTYNDAPSGGLILGGVASSDVTDSNSPTGGLVLGGTAASTKSYADAPAGGLILGGACASTKSYADAPASGIILSGTTSVSETEAAAPAGGIILGGVASSSRSMADAPAGGIVLGGSAASAKSYGDSPAGGIILGGTAPSSTGHGYADTPSGGIVLGGTAVSTRSIDYAPSGGIQLGGGATSATVQGLATSGGIVLGGSALAVLVFTSSPAGGIVLLGSTQAPAAAIAAFGVRATAGIGTGAAGRAGISSGTYSFELRIGAEGRAGIAVGASARAGIATGVRLPT